jgi:DNA ligase-1
MTIKEIFNEIANESSTLKKTELVTKYSDNELFKRVLYMANSKRVKFFIKQIPECQNLLVPIEENYSESSLIWGLDQLERLMSREKTGHEAINFLKNVLETVHPDAAYIIERVIEKDCKIGYGTRMINKVFPDLIEKTGYMGCKPYTKEGILKLLAKGPCFSQEKMDGRYMNAVVQGGELDPESRQGEPTILEDNVMFEELRSLSDCVLNGELTMVGYPRYISNGIISSLISISAKRSEGKDVTKELAKFESKHLPFKDALSRIRFTAWDMLTLDEYFNRKCKRPYHIRLRDLTLTLNGTKTRAYQTLSVVETKTVFTLQDVMDHFDEVVARDGEGTVVKSMDGVWADTKPAYQIKVKKEINLDLRVIGFNYGTKGTKNEFVISSINVKSEDDKLYTTPGGMDEDMMDYVTENQDKLMNSIIEIKCSGLSQDSKGNYSTLHPRFCKLRDDKYTANTLEECIEINNASSLI